ncbi:MAG TPA: MBL fold metallo-hydrolase [Nitrospirota bacterium]|nr:MBL fold metallo-hydrolase [Nitrospirota bacterium]
MKITCWGARGSIAVSGKEYVKYGGDTTCIEIRSNDGDIIIIDAGTGIRKLGNKLLSSDNRAYSMLFTHAHWDHLMGFPFFKPIYMKGTKIDLYGCPYAQKSVGDMLSRSMMAPYFPVEFGQLQAQIESHSVCEEAFTIGPIRITTIQLSHPNRGIGYKFIEDGKSFVFLTDNELSHQHPGGGGFEDYLRFAADADLLVHDAEYSGDQYAITKGWGHSLYTDALRLAMEAKVRQFGLFHHNQDRSDADLDRIVDDCSSIAKKGRSGLRCFAPYAGMDIAL